MAAKTIILFLAVASFVSYSTSTRNLPDIQPGFNLTARLEAGGLADRWNALMEIRSCSNEIIVFFLTGHSDISLPCYHAINIIMRSISSCLRCSVPSVSLLRKAMSYYCDSSNVTSPVPVDAPVQSLSLVA